MRLLKLSGLLLAIVLLAGCGVFGDFLVAEARPEQPPEMPMLDEPDVEFAIQFPNDVCAANTPAPDPATTTFEAPEEVTSFAVTYYAVFCTDVGAFTVELYSLSTPVTVNSFVFLAQQDFYNNQIFHRVIDGFMAQGGDPTGTGRGGPGYQFQDEIVQGLEFDRPYLLAMANAGPGTNGSQFFITYDQTPWLNGNHTIFGEVVTGQPVVDSIQLRDPRRGGPATTLETVVIVEG